ncbi:S41 family peptidase [Acetobacteraceae bacterium ESL0709]|nr:S41 family peptidase [Acetobacteraceae bacterium ESL0697]MDF7677465.1 S41 family peptidase [Acetobacteraceae bacterium ESL0709]
MIQQVIISAFTFMTPRLMQPHTAQELSLWGLSTFVTRDPELSITEITSAPLGEELGKQPPPKDNPVHKLVALRGNKLLVSADFPSDSDFQSWAALTVSIIQKTWDEDASLQALGKNRILPLFFSGIFSHLDPYSRYLSPQQARKERLSRRGGEYSIGLTLKKQPGRYPVIDTINANSLIWATGADIGQKLYEIDGHNTADASLDAINSWLTKTGPHSVTVRYGSSPSKAKSATIQLERLPPQTAFLERRKDGYLMLRVADFSTQTADEISQLLSDAFPPQTSEHKPSPLRGIIIDLRGNKGGVLQQAVMTAALFMDRGIVATTTGRYPAANHIWAIQGGDITNNSPLIILVDGLTASAAEVLAAALADHHRAVIIGTATYGKGLVQDIGQMPDGGEIFVTWSRNTAPQGEPLQTLGVIPQLCTSSPKYTITEQIMSLRQGISLQGELMKQSRAARDDTPTETLLKIRQNCPSSLETPESITAAFRLLASPEAYRTALRSVPVMADASP